MRCVAHSEPISKSLPGYARVVLDLWTALREGAEMGVINPRFGVSDSWIPI